MDAKIFIVDDHYMIIEGIRSVLHYQKSVEWMGHAINAKSFLAFLDQQEPDVIFLWISV